VSGFSQATAVFKAQVGAAGYSTYLFGVANKSEGLPKVQWEEIRLPAADVQIENSQLRVTFDGMCCMCVMCEREREGVSVFLLTLPFRY